MKLTKNSCLCELASDAEYEINETEITNHKIIVKTINNFSVALWLAGDEPLSLVKLCRFVVFMLGPLAMATPSFSWGCGFIIGQIVLCFALLCT